MPVTWPMNMYRSTSNLMSYRRFRVHPMHKSIHDEAARHRAVLAAGLPALEDNPMDHVYTTVCENWDDLEATYHWDETPRGRRYLEYVSGPKDEPVIGTFKNIEWCSQSRDCEIEFPMEIEIEGSHTTKSPSFRVVASLVSSSRSEPIQVRYERPTNVRFPVRVIDVYLYSVTIEITFTD